MLLLDLMNQVLFNGVLVHKGSRSASMKSGKSFKDEVKDFLAKVCELSNYNTKTPVDAFEAGAKLNLDEGKPEQIVNYSLEKEWIREPDRTFDRVATGDPPPSRKFRFIFITSKGIDKQYEEEQEYDAIPPNPHIGDIITTNIHHAEQSPIQIGKGSTQNDVLSDGQIEELRKILAKIEQTTRDKGSEIPSDKESEVELDVRDINQEIVKPKGDRDNSKILTKVRSLGDKIKDLAPYVGLAAQISGWVFSLSN
jgi:hypothetical protein